MRALRSMTALFMALLFLLPGLASALSDLDIKQAARMCSVQPVFHIPVLKVYFCEPLEEEEKEYYTKQELDELLDRRIRDEETLKELMRDVLLAEKKRWDENRYESSLTEIDVYGFESPAPNFVPLGALVPDYARFPDRVVVVTEIDEEEIKAWERDYEKDIMTISEVAGVSLPQAKSIVTRLGYAGYRVLRKEEKTVQAIRLLWFDDGWDDEYPLTLNWSVELEGTKQNIIVGYLGDGLLEVSPIPKDTRVHVKAGYLDLKDAYKPKDQALLSAESRIENLEKRLEDEIERLKEKDEEIDRLKRSDDAPGKRDISKATWLDVLIGRVCIKRLYMISAASGVYLGSIQVDDKIWGYQSGLFDIQHFTEPTRGVVLTNAHVASHSTSFEIHVSEDKEVMWIFYPAFTRMRYTRDSDMIGSPAQLLYRDKLPVMTWDYDAALMVTTEVPYLNRYAAELGDSDLVTSGDRIVSVGNPAMMQKYTTQGVVSNKDYSVWDSLNAEWWIQKVPSLQVYNWVKNSNFWYDCPIGTGGTSGSGVWALDGQNRGKLVALHNMGMNIPLGVTDSRTQEYDFDPKMVEYKEDEILLVTYLRDKRDVMFLDLPYEKARYSYDVERFVEGENGFGDALTAHGYWVRLAGMNGAVPINPIKRYLQERGITKIKWLKGLDDPGRDHWIK